MESKKEIGRFSIGMSLLQETNEKITTNFINKNFNVPNDIILSQLNLFTRMLEDNNYQDFRNNINTI